MPLMMLAITTNSGAGVDFVRMSATISEVAGSLPPVTLVMPVLGICSIKRMLGEPRIARRDLRTDAPWSMPARAGYKTCPRRLAIAYNIIS